MVTGRAILAERFAAQALAGPPLADPVAVTERLLAVQGQDPRGFRLAIRARTEGLSTADVDRALSEDRALLVTWLNRGTLQLVRSEDYPWLHALTTPPLSGAAARRLEQLGVSAATAERGVELIERSLEEEGPLTRLQLRQRLERVRVPTEGQALVHLLMLASLQGIAVRGPVVGKQHAYVLVRDWLDPPAPLDREKALRELARRYLAGHAPASDRDLAKWAGLPLRDARAALAGLGSRLESAGGDLVRLRGRERPCGVPPARLLGAFDPLLLGWTTREAILGAHAPRIVSGGLFRPFALVRGRAAGVWKWAKGKVSLDELGQIPARAASALERDAADVARFLEGRSAR